MSTIYILKNVEKYIPTKVGPEHFEIFVASPDTISKMVSSLRKQGYKQLGGSGRTGLWLDYGHREFFLVTRDSVRIMHRAGIVKK